MMKVIAVICLFVAVALGATGVDISDSVSQSDFSCFKQKGFSYAIVRCFRSSGHTDPNCASNAANAKAAGMTSVDVYVFPCPKCGSAASQIDATVSYLQQHNVQYHTMWFDIEGPQYWSSTSSNVAFFQAMVSEAKAKGVNIGVYTSKSQWEPIMGSSTAGSSFPLWYAHYDGKQSFSDFQAFGGWSKPYMKQYLGDQNGCSTGADYNWMPGGPNSTSSSTSGHTSGPSSSSTGPTSSTGGNSSTSNPSSTSGNSSTSNPSSTSSYSSGTSSSTGDIRLSEDSIYNKIGGGKMEHSRFGSGSPRQKTKIDIMVEEIEAVAERDDHFQLSEEKMPKKFF